MTEELPNPASREESYLAKAAGMNVEIPEEPRSRLEEYLNAIANNGGGGGGGTSDFNDLTNRPKYNGTAMTGETDIPAVPSVVQTTGTSTTDIMSQKAASQMVFADPVSYEIVKIGKSASSRSTECIAIGKNADALGAKSIAIGGDSRADGNFTTVLGHTATCTSSGHRNTCLGAVSSIGSSVAYSVALGSHSVATRTGEVNIGTGNNSYGYNSTQYRVLGGVHDPVDNHDAATKGYVDGLVGNVATALAAINNGTGA